MNNMKKILNKALELANESRKCFLFLPEAFLWGAALLGGGSLLTIGIVSQCILK